MKKTKKKSEKIIEKLDDYFLPKSNPSVETHKFNSRVQYEEETFEHFYSEITKLAVNCNFGDMKDRLIKDRIVSGIRDLKIKERLLREQNLNLNKSLEICRAAEQADLHMKEMLIQTSRVEIGGVDSHRMNNWNGTKYGVEQKRQNFTKFEGKCQNRVPENNNYRETSGGLSMSNKVFNNVICGRCGFRHFYNKNCPAQGKQCNKCRKCNHFASVCRNRMINTINEYSSEPSSSLNHDLSLNNNFIIDTIHINSLDTTKENDWFEELFIKNCNSFVKFKLDTGA